jgi:uncharacterized protein YacL
MRTLFSLKPGWAFAIYALLDILCVGMGMGVPFFNILLGLLVGVSIVKRIAVASTTPRMVLRKILSAAAFTAAFTFILMVLIWGFSLLMFFNSGADLANYGMPMILYEPLPSFIGWMVLMIVISPFLQFLMTLFGAHLTWWVETAD